ncbi:MAG: YdcF family protein [Rhizomicrobium sp.]
MIKRLAQVVGVLIAMYVAGFAWFVASLPARPTHSLNADGIVALTGGDARLDAAVALFEGGTGKRLLITGANKVSTKAELKYLSKGGRRFECCADIGYAAEDTYGNAEEAAEWTARHRFHSLIVVTAGYHMPRSLVLFRARMPGVTLIAYPVEPADARAWWKPGTLHLLHNEYLKYMASLVMTVVDRHAPGGKSAATS